MTPVDRTARNASLAHAAKPFAASGSQFAQQGAHRPVDRARA